MVGEAEDEDAAVGDECLEECGSQGGNVVGDAAKKRERQEEFSPRRLRRRK